MGPDPLQDAVSRNDPAAIKTLLDIGASDACARNGARWSWLAEALRLGHREAARAFLDHPRGFGWESQCWSLHGLLQGPHDDPDLLQALLDREAHLPYVDGGPPLEHTLAESGHPRIARAIFERCHLLPGVLDEAGWVPLFRAIRAGDVATAQVFLDHGASLNARIEWRDRRGALHIALEARKNREAVIRWLLDHGIDTRLIDEGGRTAGERAIEAGQSELAHLIREDAGAGGPRWHREAVKAGMNDVISPYFSRGAGLCFDPNDVTHPFLIGGDHDGSYPETPLAALDFIRRTDQNSDLGRAIAPWTLLIERMLSGKDVGLDEVLALGARRNRP